jgi:hypothetical protein
VFAVMLGKKDAREFTPQAQVGSIQQNLYESKNDLPGEFKISDKPISEVCN